MDFETIFLQPITISFFVIALGLCIGKIKVFNVSLSTAAVLIVAVFVGFLMSKFETVAIDDTLNSYMKMFSSLGSTLFVAAIGLNTGYSMTRSNTGKISSSIVGSLMIVSSFFSMWLMSKCSIGVTRSNLLGILCGALTTTPGLSAVCDKGWIVSEEASLGYGSAYLFGVIFTVLFVQFITRNENVKISEQTATKLNVTNKTMYGGLVQLSIVILFGRIIGNVTVPATSFSLGNSCGILFAGMIVGYIICKFFNDRCISKEQQLVIKNLGLVLFFVGNGIPAGIQMNESFSIKAIFIGGLLTVVPVLVGFFVCKVIFRKSNIEVASIISGGMTSTPAVGVLDTKCDVAYDEYSFAYTGALITIMVGMQLV